MSKECKIEIKNRIHPGLFSSSGKLISEPLVGVQDGLFKVLRQWQ
jgi:hypothetical protein